MLRIISIILFLIILLVGVEFSAVNSGPVTVNYVLGTAVLPLSLVVACAFSLGLLVAAVISIAIILPLRWRLIRLQRTVSSQEQEIGTLQRRSDQDIRRV
jgi:uncharacterized membrane protein YciS (DUF1049 family)